MLNLKSKAKAVIALTFGGLLSSMILYGCTSNPSPTTAETTAPAAEPPKFALFGPPPRKSGVELWSDNCTRCHNLRTPETFSDAQWETLVHHMRLRANLTGEESREIVKFLQASN